MIHWTRIRCCHLVQICIITSLFSGKVASSQTNPDRFLQEEQLRREDLLKQQAIVPEKKTLQVEKPKLPPKLPESQQTFQIEEIELMGVTVLSSREKLELIEPYLGTLMGLAEISELQRDITNIYIDGGWITSRVYIPEQDLQSGRLDLIVVEGSVGDILMDEGGRAVNVATAFPGVKGEVLNLRDFEQGIEQLNRLQSNFVTMAIEPGADIGSSQVRLSNESSCPISGSFMVDNFGRERTDSYRGSVSVGIDHLFHLNEYIGFNYTRNLSSRDNENRSESILANARIPFGYWTLEGYYSSFDYNNDIPTATEFFESNGATDTGNLNLKRVLHRGQASMLTAELGFTYKSTENFIANSLLESSSRDLSIINLGLVSTFSAFGGSITLGGGVEQGVLWFGAEELPGAGTGSVPTAESLKYTVFGSYSRAIRTGSVPVSFSSYFGAQFTEDYLFGSEQIAVGGVYTVRGFGETSISGDRGAYLRNELVFQLPEISAFEGRFSAILLPYVAIDVGWIDSREGQPGGDVSGYAIGLRKNSGRWVFDVSYSNPISYPDEISNSDRFERDIFTIKAGIQL